MAKARAISLHHPIVWAVLGVVLFALVTTSISEHAPEPVEPVTEPQAETPIATQPVPEQIPAEPGPDTVGGLLDQLGERRTGMSPITTKSYEITNLPIGTSIGEEFAGISEDDFGAAEIHTRNGVTAYRQYVRFTGDGVQSGSVQFTENEFGQVGPFLTFQQGDTMFEYGILFEGGLESMIEDNQLRDIQSREFLVAGRQSTITRSRISGNQLELRLTSGGKRALVKEGEERTLFAGFSIIRVRAEQISSGATPQVTFLINGERTPALAAGQRITFNDGLSLTVLQLLPNEAGDGKDIADVVIGSTTLTLQDDFTDDTFSSSVEINGRTQLGSTVQFKGTVSGEEFRLTSIRFRAAAHEDTYLAAGTPLSETAQPPSAAGVDIGYQGLQQVQTALIRFRPSGDGYRLTFFNVNGKKYETPFFDSSGTFRYGDDDKELWWVEASSTTDYRIAEGDYLVLTSGSTHKGITHVLQYDALDTANKQVTFTDLAQGQKTFTYTETGVAGQLGEGTISLGRITARFTIGDNGRIAIDLNGGGISGGSADIVTMGGGILDLGSAQDISGSSSVTVTLTTQRVKIQDATSDETVQILFNSGGDMDVSIPTGQSALRMRKAGSDLEQGMTTYGALFELAETSGDRSILTIEYPLTQRFVDVSVNS